MLVRNKVYVVLITGLEYYINLPGEHAFDHEQFACNVVAHVVDRAVFNFNEKF